MLQARRPADHHVQRGLLSASDRLLSSRNLTKGRQRECCTPCSERGVACRQHTQTLGMTD